MSAPNQEGFTNPAVLSGGVFGAIVGSPSGDGPVEIVGNSLFYSVSFTPVAVANAATIQLVDGLNVLRPTSDTTIAGAVLNLPTNPNNGDQVRVSTTGQITTVTGTLNSATLPAITQLTAGQVINVGFNSAVGSWLRV